MPHLLPICLLLLLSACGSSPQKPATEKPATETVIALSDSVLLSGGTDTVRFGHLYSGETAVKQLRLRNNASRPLVITTYRRSCGCTTLAYEKQPITPGGELPLTLSFDSRGEHGWQLRTVDIVFGGAEKPLRLFIEADVE